MCQSGVLHPDFIIFKKLNKNRSISATYSAKQCYNALYIICISATVEECSLGFYFVIINSR